MPWKNLDRIRRSQLYKAWPQTRGCGGIRLRYPDNEIPTEHWSAVEVPVVWNPFEDRLAYLERTPFWGAFYWSSLRGEIRDKVHRD